MRQEDGVAMEMYMLLPVLYALRRYDRVCAADTPTVGTGRRERHFGERNQRCWLYFTTYEFEHEKKARSSSSVARARDLQVGGLEFDSLRGRSGGRFRPSVCAALSVLLTHPPPSSGRNHISCDQPRIRNPGGCISIGATREDSL